MTGIPYAREGLVVVQLFDRGQPAPEVAAPRVRGRPRLAPGAPRPPCVLGRGHVVPAFAAGRDHVVEGPVRAVHQQVARLGERVALLHAAPPDVGPARVHPEGAARFVRGAPGAARSHGGGDRAVVAHDQGDVDAVRLRRLGALGVRVRVAEVPRPRGRRRNVFPPRVLRLELGAGQRPVVDVRTAFGARTARRPAFR